MRLYKKEKDWSNYWEVDVNFPWIGRRKTGLWDGESPDFDTPHYAYGFSFPTECFLHREDEYYWHFTLRILGFGVTIVRQKGY
jgi:hypothetical protein